jgi:hypothetical protein
MSQQHDDWATVERLIGRGCSPAEAVDYHAVENRGETVIEWAKTRGISHQAVSKNVRHAREQLQETRVDA